MYLRAMFLLSTDIWCFVIEASNVSKVKPKKNLTKLRWKPTNEILRIFLLSISWLLEFAKYVSYGLIDHKQSVTKKNKDKY